MKAIRRQLKRSQVQLYGARRRLERARRLAIEKGSGSTCIAALSKALADNAKAHQDIDDIGAMLEAPNPHFKPRRH